MSEGLVLTPSEIQIITDSWSLVKPDMQGNGILLFSIFFGDYPQHKKFFNFTGEVEDIPNNPKLRAHALKVVTELSYIVENVTNTEVVLAALQKNASNHKKRNIPAPTYDHLRDTLLKFVKQQQGGACDPKLIPAWDKALMGIFKVITDQNS